MPTPKHKPATPLPFELREAQGYAVGPNDGVGRETVFKLVLIPGVNV